MRFRRLHRKVTPKVSVTKDIESIIERAKTDVETAIRDAVPVAQDAASIVQDVRTLDLSALLADIGSVLHGHLSAAGITPTNEPNLGASVAQTVPKDPAGITRTSGEPATGAGSTSGTAQALPADVGAALAAETSGEPADATVAAGSMGAEAEGVTREAPGADVAEADPAGITRAQPGQQ